MPRRQLHDAIHQCPGTGDIVHREITVETFHAETAVDLRMDQERLQLRAEDDVFAVMGEVERLDPHAIARKHEAPFRLLPQGDAEHAAHPAKALRIPFKEGMEYGLGIAMGMETVAKAFEFPTQLEVVIDFAVEDDDGIAITREERLVARSEVENLQSGCAHRTQARVENSLLVGSAMRQGSGGGANPIRIGGPALLCKASNAAQRQNPLERSKTTLPLFPAWRQSSRSSLAIPGPVSQCWQA